LTTPRYNDSAGILHYISHNVLLSTHKMSEIASAGLIFGDI